jgi:hypothetical protein
MKKGFHLESFPPTSRCILLQIPALTDPDSANSIAGSKCSSIIIIIIIMVDKNEKRKTRKIDGFDMK